MRAHGIPQFTVDAHRPVSAFDVLGVSFSTELGYTNLLTALDLAGIPLSAADRTITRPGRARGRARGVQPRAARRLPRRRGHRRRRGGRARRHRDHPRVEAGRLPGRAGRPAAVARRDRRRLRPEVLRRDVPPDGRIGQVTPEPAGRPRVGAQAHAARTWTPGRTRRRRSSRSPRPCTSAYSVEIFRGCTRGCRFCQAGMITRPVRERSITTVGNMVKSRPEVDRLLRGRPALAVERRPQRDQRDRRSTWPTATRASTSACRCRPPGSTPSTSPSPTSCQGTASAPA